jgi:cbb3-type cytochrome c oxidase subunit III
VKTTEFHFQSYALLMTTIAGTAWLIAGCASTGNLAREEANFPKEKVNARGLFLENCAKCHGQDGRASTFHSWLVGAQDLTDAGFQLDTSDKQIIQAIKNGPMMMPAFGEKLSEAEIEALAAYVRSLNEGVLFRR